MSTRGEPERLLLLLNGKDTAEREEKAFCNYVNLERESVV
jgi:hypothetical protein